MENENKKKSIDALRYAAAAGILLLLFSPLLKMAGRTVVPAADAEPVYETTATWGDFDEVRLFRYFRLEDVPALESVPPYDVEYRGETWEYVETYGEPVRIEFGDCWEAMYRKGR